MRFLRSFIFFAIALLGVATANAQEARSPLWTGAYAGIHGGNAVGKFTNGFALDQSLDGASGGLHVGYNAQVSNIVFGLEAEVDIGHANGATREHQNASFQFHFRTSRNAEYRRERMVGLRGRLGYTFGPLLAYATGGFAAAKFGYDSIVVAGGFSNHSARQDTNVGGIWGGGLAYRIDARYSVNIEGLRHSYSPVIYSDYKYRETNVRAGLSWHFN